MLWSEWLKLYKGTCTSDCVLWLSRTPYLQNICVAWRNCAVTFPLTHPVPSGVVIDKSMAWSCVNYDLHELSCMSGHPVGHCTAYMKQAIALDMIYPDGTLNPAADKLISAIIAKNIKAAAK